MADVKVCDRCGKRLTDERSTFNVKPITTRFVLSATLFKKPRYGWEKTLDIVNTQHDLCMDCTVKLSDWMQSKTTEDNT